MNELSIEQRTRILGCLVEGMCVRATSRLTGAAKGTILKLVREVGPAAEAFQRRWFVGLDCERIQVDEIWDFIAAKQRTASPEAKAKGAGDSWTWTALCADSKLILTWLVGSRRAEHARAFMRDLPHRLNKGVQLTSDGYPKYPDAVELAFGANVDYAMLVKQYRSDHKQKQPEVRYTPGEVVGVTITRMCGDPDENHVSTSYVERSNLTIRMQNRRFTRLTNAFSKTVAYHRAALAIAFFYYNLIRKHSSLRGKTPAMAAGITDHAFTLRDMLFVADMMKADVTDAA